MDLKQHPSIPLTLLGTSIFSICLFHFMAYQTDTPSFVTAVEILLHESTAPDRLYRLSKPLALLFPAFLYKCCAVPISYGFLIQQVLAYFVSAIFLYKLLEQVLHQKHLAYCGMLAFVLCQAMPVYGLAMLTDGFGWAWLIVGCWWSLRMFEKNAASTALIGLGIFFGLGLFIKESILIAGLFTFFLILLTPRFSAFQKIAFYVQIGLSFLATFILGSYLIQFLFEQSLFDWMAFGHSDPPPFNLKGILLQSYRSLDVFWLLVPLGLRSFTQQSKKTPALQAIFCTALLAWILLPLTWPYLYDRILFMIAPFMMVGIALGFSYFGRMALPLVLIGGLSNLLVTFAIYKYQIGGLLIITATLYFLLLLASYYYTKQLT